MFQNAYDFGGSSGLSALSGGESAPKWCSHLLRQPSLGAREQPWNFTEVADPGVRPCSEGVQGSEVPAFLQSLGIHCGVQLYLNVLSWLLMT